MATIMMKNVAGEDVREITLKDFIFGVPANDTLLHQVYVAQTSNARQVVAHTKDRSERAGSGIKPWRQKGTGRARAGEVRSPIWRKGGITFGPTKERNFSKDTNKKMRQKAVLVALSQKLRAGKMIVLDALIYPEKKTKLFAHTVDALGIAGKSFTVSFTGNDERVLSIMSRNISKVENALTENLNVVQLLDQEYLVITAAGIKALEERFALWSKKAAQ